MPTTLLTLPAEVPNLICRHYFSGSYHTYLIRARNEHLDSDSTYKLLTVCKVISAEARPIHLDLSSCYFDHPFEKLQWYRRAPTLPKYFSTIQCKYLRSLIVTASIPRDLEDALMNDTFPMLQELKASRCSRASSSCNVSFLEEKVLKSPVNDIVAGLREQRALYSPWAMRLVALARNAKSMPRLIVYARVTFWFPNRLGEPVIEVEVRLDTMEVLVLSEEQRCRLEKGITDEYTIK